MWNLQTLGATVLITFVDEPEAAGQARSEGDLLLSEQGCFAVESDFGIAVLAPRNTAVLVAEDAFEIDGERYAVGDRIAFSGGGTAGDQLPESCDQAAGSQWAASIERVE